MRKFLLILLSYLIFTNIVNSQEKFFQPDDLFHIDNMDSHNKEFSLYFKGREKSILARGEESNYIMIIQKICIFTIIQLSHLLL